MEEALDLSFDRLLIIIVIIIIIIIIILTTVTLASTSNAIPEDGVIDPKHVGAILMLILM